jgi:phage gp46-like protein
MTNCIATPPAKTPRNMFNMQAHGGSFSYCGYSNGGKCDPWDFVCKDGRLISSQKIASLVAMHLSTNGAHKSECGELTGGWWADSYRVDGFKSPSLLYLLKSKRADSEALLMAKEYAEKSLKKLSELINAVITVSAKYVARGVMELIIYIKGDKSSLQGSWREKEWLWQEVK